MCYKIALSAVQLQATAVSRIADKRYGSRVAYDAYTSSTWFSLHGSYLRWAPWVHDLSTERVQLR